MDEMSIQAKNANRLAQDWEDKYLRAENNAKQR